MDQALQAEMRSAGGSVNGAGILTLIFMGLGTIFGLFGLGSAFDGSAGAGILSIVVLALNIILVIYAFMLISNGGKLKRSANAGQLEAPDLPKKAKGVVTIALVLAAALLAIVVIRGVVQLGGATSEMSSAIEGGLDDARSSMTDEQQSAVDDAMSSMTDEQREMADQFMESGGGALAAGLTGMVWVVFFIVIALVSIPLILLLVANGKVGRLAKNPALGA